MLNQTSQLRILSPAVACSRSLGKRIGKFCLYTLARQWCYFSMLLFWINYSMRVHTWGMSSIGPHQDILGVAAFHWGSTLVLADLACFSGRSQDAMGSLPIGGCLAGLACAVSSSFGWLLLGFWFFLFCVAVVCCQHSWMGYSQLCIRWHCWS